MQRIFFMNISEVSTFRSQLMGIATLMIFFGHTVFYGQGTINYGILNDIVTLGYSGVDIFLFLSGFGLVYSIKRNNKRTFYSHRVSRLLPSVIFIMILYCVTNIKGADINWFNPLFWFQEYWYIGFCIVSYILFPYLYNFSLKRNGYGILVVALLISLGLLFPFIIRKEAQSTAYSCFLTRIPIFILGMLFALNKCHKMFSARVLLILLVFGLVSLIPYKLNNDLGGNIYFNTYYSIFLITPPLLQLVVVS